MVYSSVYGIKGRSVFFGGTLEAQGLCQINRMNRFDRARQASGVMSNGRLLADREIGVPRHAGRSGCRLLADQEIGVPGVLADRRSRRAIFVRSKPEEFLQFRLHRFRPETVSFRTQMQEVGHDLGR